jgi:hypothetical protein
MLGMDRRPRLVVRANAPTRRVILIAALSLLGLFAFYVVYELGRYNAGYDRLAVAQQRTELEVVIERLEKSNRQLRTQLAELDTIRVGRAREQAEVARAMGDLQAQVARQSQELAFYRGVVTQGAALLGVKVEEVRISATPKPGHFMVHLSLVRSGRPDNVASGTLLLSVEGGGSGEDATTLDLPALTAGKLRELPFNFRYFENFDQEIAIPPGFKPEHLAVEVRSSRKDVTPLAQQFLWSVQPVSP